jgi:serine/threonine protein kinase
VSLLYSSSSGSKGCVLALEAVEPIGFDLDRLVRQYSFAQQSVPELLAKRLIQQLASALQMMHSKNIIHRDVKVENALVTEKYDAKLIDMGIAVEIGTSEERWIWSPKSYFAPEVCCGEVPQGTEVDCWGLGLILHQMYQNRWDILDSSKSIVKFRPNRPCQSEPMTDDLKEAMFNLLKFEPKERWTLAEVVKNIPCETDQKPASEDWQAPAAEKQDARRCLRKYKDQAPPLSAFAAVVDGKNKHLCGKRLDELQLRNKHGATLLIVDYPADKKTRKQRFLITSPKRDTIIEEGAWLYFGHPPTSGVDEAMDSLTEELGLGAGRSTDSKAGLMAFSLEFDCFEFPKHISSKSAIGPTAPEGGTALNLRKHFGLNIAGIKRRDSAEPVWFPGPDEVVEHGDLGLIVRCPCRDGTTDPTVVDADLEPLLNEAKFNELQKNELTDVVPIGSG